MTDLSAGEFSRPVATARLAGTPVHLETAATEGERRALVARLGLVDLVALAAKADLEAMAGEQTVYRIRAAFEATVIQECVVTLEPFEATVSETFQVDYSPAASVSDWVVPEGEEPPEPLEGEVIDVGELVAQYLALALDPHPRRPGALLDRESGADGDGDGAVADHPFAALAAIRGPRGGAG